MVLLVNQVKFRQDKFKDESFEFDSNIFWYSLTPSAPTDYVNTVQRSQYMLDDFAFRIGSWSAIEKTGFEIVRTFNREMPYARPFQTAITFELSPDLKHFYRSTYGTLDFLAEIGGLLSAIRPLCMILVLIMQYYGAYQFVMSELFVSKSRNSRPKSYTEELEVKNNVQWSICKSMQLNCQTFLSCSHCCCRPSHRQRLKIKSYKYFLSEISVLNILQQLRVLIAAAKQQRSASQWHEIVEENKLKAFQDFESADSDNLQQQQHQNEFVRSVTMRDTMRDTMRYIDQSDSDRGKSITSMNIRRMGRGDIIRSKDR